MDEEKISGGDKCSINYSINNHIITNNKTMNRWIMAMILSLINIGNSMLWISFAPITDKVAFYYETNSTGVLAMANIFIAVLCLLGLPIIWTMDHLKVHQNMTVAVILNSLSSLFRIFSSATFVPSNLRFYFILIGQVFAGFSQPWSLFLTSRLANEWFPAEERPLANTMTSISMSMGAVIINAIAPLFFDEETQLQDSMVKLNWIVALPNILAFLSIFLFCFIKTNESKYSNSSSSNKNNNNKDSLAAADDDDHLNSLPLETNNNSNGTFKERLSMEWKSAKLFLISVFSSLKNIHFILLIIYFSTIVTLILTTATLISLLMCSRGYSNNIAGLCNCLLLGIGIFSSLGVSYIAGKIGRLVEIVKICFTLAFIACIVFYILVRTYNNEIWLLITVAFLSLFGLPNMSLPLELGVECTYPLSETHSTGLLWIIAQTVNLIWMTIMEEIAQPIKNENEIKNATCEKGVVPKDYTWESFGMLSVSLIIVIITLIFLKSPYLRRKSEEKEVEILETEKINNMTAVEIEEEKVDVIKIISDDDE